MKPQLYEIIGTMHAISISNTHKSDIVRNNTDMAARLLKTLPALIGTLQDLRNYIEMNGIPIPSHLDDEFEKRVFSLVETGGLDNIY